MKRRPDRRSGYALMLVFMFIVLLLALLMTAYRSVASAVRIESARSLQVARDEGSTRAMAKAMALLETGLPPGSPYVCGVTIPTTSGDRAFTVTFTLESGTIWTVSTAATGADESPAPMPATFARLP
jgi:hypothetical protein